MTIASQSRPAEQRWRMVVIGGSPDDRAEIRRLLLLGSQRRYELVETATDAAGLRATLSDPDGPPRCVILGDHLPDRPTQEVLAELTGAAQGGMCPVVVVTSGDGHDQGPTVLQAGAHDYVDRRWMTPQSLTRAVENAVERWSLARELRASETRFRLLASAVPQPVRMVDAAGRPVYVNERWREYFGPLTEAHERGEWQTLFPPEEAAHTLGLISALDARGTAYELVHRLRRHDGESRWHHTNVVPLRDASGALTHWYSVHTDIHEVKENEARLRLALEASRTGIWTWDVQTDAVTWSPECHVIHGVGPGEFAGTGAAFFELVHPDDRAHVGATVRGAIAAHDLYQVEFRVVRPDGEVVWVQNRGRASYDAEGAARVLGTITDVTRRRRAEQELRARECELQTIADNTPDIIARFDRDLRHVYVNAAVERATGRPPSDFIGKTNRELGMPAELCDRWDAAMRGVLTTGQPGTVSFDFMGPGGLRHYSNHMVCEASADGGPAHILVVTHDITERKKIEDALREALNEAEQAVRARDQMVSLVSHDLKSPLSALLLGIHLLQRHVVDTGREMLRRMGRQAQAMNHLIDELLDVAQLHAGQPLRLDLQSIDLVSLVRGVAEDHAAGAPRHRIDVRVGAATLIGRWDAKRIARVVNNLLANAIKYSPEGGPVWIELNTRDEDGGWAVLQVRDEGIGVAEEDRASVFQWFSRGQNARLTAIEGTGIGLAGSRDIVEQHGGSISLVSELGKGSTFTVRLPTAPPLPRRVPGPMTEPRFDEPDPSR